MGPEIMVWPTNITPEDGDMLVQHRQYFSLFRFFFFMQHSMEASVGLLRFVWQKAPAFAKNTERSSFTAYLDLCHAASFKAARQLPKDQLPNATSQGLL